MASGYFRHPQGLLCDVRVLGDVSLARYSEDDREVASSSHRASCHHSACPSIIRWRVVLVGTSASSLATWPNIDSRNSCWSGSSRTHVSLVSSSLQHCWADPTIDLNQLPQTFIFYASSFRRSATSTVCVSVLYRTRSQQNGQMMRLYLPLNSDFIYWLEQHKRWRYCYGTGLAIYSLLQVAGSSPAWEPLHSGLKVNAGLVESNGITPLNLWLMSPVC